MLKRIFDILFSSTLLVLLSPLMLFIAAAIRFDSPGPILFRQRRAGLKGQEFWVYKFRTMVPGTDRGGPVKSAADPRVTMIGRIIRPLGLDELPQLALVLLGEMSLIGPRPLLLESIKPEEMRRLEMKPGLTSLPIVSGDNLLDWEQRMTMDLDYVDNWTLGLDFLILLRTIPVALFRTDAYDEKGSKD